MPELTRTQLATYAAIVFVVVLVGSRVLASQASGGRGSADTVASSSGEASSSANGGDSAGGDGTADGGVAVSGPASGPSVVHVAGDVHRAGVYRLPAGARVDDAIRRAGGARPGADVDDVNLAAKVVDGQQIMVPKRGAAVAGAAAGAGAAGSAAGATGDGTGAPTQPVSLNSASADQLDTLDGVGPSTAQKIIAYRTQHGGFRSVDELAEVPGIGPKKLAALRGQVQP